VAQDNFAEGVRRDLFVLPIMGDTEPNYLLGFGLTCVAGATNCVGVAFIPLVNSGLLTEKKGLAAALSFAAGVMIWLAFMGILGGEAYEFFVAAYNDHGHTHGPGYVNEEPYDIRIWILVFFLLGLAITAGMEQLVDRYFEGAGHGHSHGHAHHGHAEESGGHAHSDHSVELTNTKDEGFDGQPSAAAGEGDGLALMKISVMAMLGLCLHQLPEGLAVFLSASSADLTILIGIALHHLPGGAAIAVPIFKSTGSYMKALAATAFAGAAMPLGALIGWVLIIGLGLTRPTDWAYGAMYSATGGMLMAVALTGMLPAAFASASNFFVLCWLALGFAVMEASIILMVAMGGHGHSHG